MNNTCPRCNGLLVTEPVIEDGVKIYMHRCPLCGFYTDAQAEQNRRIAQVSNNRNAYGPMKKVRA